LSDSYGIPAGSIEDRAVGAFVGLAVGDALGTPVEFKARGTFPPVTDMRGGGVFGLNPGEWTDDTSMALALGEALLKDPTLSDPAPAMNRWVNWYEWGMYSHNDRCFDIGNQTAAALSNWSINRSLPERDTESAGNGSIMRLAPAVIANLNNADLMLDVARRQSDLTHKNTECRSIAAKMASLLAALIVGQGQEEIPSEIAKRREAEVKSTGYVIDTFEAAVWAFAPRDGFRNILLRAVNLGDDADTVGAVAGQIAGAAYGLSGIPESWLDVLAWRSKIIEMGRQLYALASR
jgi:ADP-ribosyl-[dinitrogen reductase] hydrolase